MTIQNALASVATKDLDAAVRWYETLLGAPARRPMPEVAEWTFPRGGGLQVYALAERAGACSCTLAVDDLAPMLRTLGEMNVDTSQRSTSKDVDVVMIVDPDGNHLAIARALSDRVAR